MAYTFLHLVRISTIQNQCCEFALEIGNHPHALFSQPHKCKKHLDNNKLLTVFFENWHYSLKTRQYPLLPMKVYLSRVKEMIFNFRSIAYKDQNRVGVQDLKTASREFVNATSQFLETRKAPLDHSFNWNVRKDRKRLKSYTKVFWGWEIPQIL